jgi:uncharacterized membrane protein (DUF485 family)
MPGFDAPPPPSVKEAPSSPRQIRFGQVLFVFYLLLYAGFMALNAFDPEAMEQTPWAGVNLAILYGLGLIVVAFVLAVIYDVACRWLAARPPRDKEAAR